MAQAIDWEAKAKRARAMTEAELLYAQRDALEAAIALGDRAMRGKDSSYYRDEASIYRDELQRRNARRSGRTQNRRSDRL